MGSAYIYKNILDGVENPVPKNYEYAQANDITVTPIRKTDILFNIEKQKKWQKIAQC